MKIEYPFVDVSDRDLAFGYHGDIGDLYKKCPKKFKESKNKYSELFNKIFFKGLTTKELEDVKYKSSDKMYIKVQHRFLRSIMVSYEPKHEHKEAICSWLLSLMIV